MASERTERTYRLEPLDSSGVFLGLGFIQCGLLGAGITLAVLIITAGFPLAVAAAPDMRRAHDRSPPLARLDKMVRLRA